MVPLFTATAAATGADPGPSSKENEERADEKEGGEEREGARPWSLRAMGKLSSATMEVEEGNTGRCACVLSEAVTVVAAAVTALEGR